MTRLRAGTKTSAEDVLAIELAATDGLTFERQFQYAKPRRLRADFAIWNESYMQGWDAGRRVLVEVQGGIYNGKAHGSVTGILADIDRLNTATLAGWALLRFTPQQVDSGDAMNTINAYLKDYHQCPISI